MERFAFLNSIVEQLNAALAGVGTGGRNLRLSIVLGPESPIPGEVARIGSGLAAEGLAWDHIERFLSLRDELHQIDTRFGQIGPRGIFTELDRRGVLDHKVAAVDGIEAAMREPPSVGRARLRGEAVRRLSGHGRAGCSWAAVVGPDGRALDLSDPFAAAEAWSDAQTQDLEYLPPDVQMEDPGHLQNMLDAMRRRYGRPRTRAQGPPEAA